MVTATAELTRRKPRGLAGCLLGALLLLAGCVPPEMGTPSPRARTPVPAPMPAPAPPASVAVVRPVPDLPEARSGTVEPAPAPATPRTLPPASPASQALLNQSRSHQAAGRYGEAAAAIERALRIEPRQPLLWLELGNVRLKEGDFAQAESLGRKALSLSAGDAALTARAEQLIATAKKR